MTTDTKEIKMKNKQKHSLTDLNEYLFDTLDSLTNSDLEIYELAYGEVPKGYMVTFKDGDKEHIALDNLEMISMQQNVRMNSNGLRQLQVDGIFETAKAVADLTIAIAEAKKNLRC